jgi:hypothetical protein
MAKKKSRKIEKETRRLIEAMADLVKKSKNGDTYKFKSGSKKQIRRMKKTCVHWIIRKGKETPAVKDDPEKAGYFKCRICGASFPINPLTSNEYREAYQTVLSYINQQQFYSIQMGGDSSDTKRFLRLKEDIPELMKMTDHIVKYMNKWKNWEETKNRENVLSQFKSYSGYSYN